MNTTEEWLRYIESKAIMDRYGIKGYTKDKKETEDKDESVLDSTDNNS